MDYFKDLNSKRWNVGGKKLKRKKYLVGFKCAYYATFLSPDLVVRFLHSSIYQGDLIFCFFLCKARRSDCEKKKKDFLCREIEPVPRESIA